MATTAKKTSSTKKPAEQRKAVRSQPRERLPKSWQRAMVQGDADEREGRLLTFEEVFGP